MNSVFLLQFKKATTSFVYISYWMVTIISAITLVPVGGLTLYCKCGCNKDNSDREFCLYSALVIIWIPLTVFVRWIVNAKLAKDLLPYLDENMTYRKTYFIGIPVKWSIAAETSLVLTCFFIFDLLVRLTQPTIIQNKPNKDNVNGKSTKES